MPRDEDVIGIADVQTGSKLGAFEYESKASRKSNRQTKRLTTLKMKLFFFD